MNARERAALLPLSGAAGPLADLLKAAGDCECAVVFDNLKFFDAPEWVVSLGELGDDDLRPLTAAAAALARAALPVENGVERRPAEIGVRLNGETPSALWLEYAGAKPCRVVYPLNGRRLVRPSRRLRYRSGCLGAPDVDAAFSLLDDRHPIAGVCLHNDGAEFTLAAAVPWTRFARLDIAVPFEGRAAELAARLGAFSVGAVGLESGAMTIRLA